MKEELDILFTQPILSNGILGGTAFAVSAEEAEQSNFVAVEETMEFKQEDWDKLNEEL